MNIVSTYDTTPADTTPADTTPSGAIVIDGAANAQELLDSGTFYTKNQKPIVLEDYDTSRGTFVNFKTADGRKNIFGDAPNGNSTIRGGSGNDSIYAGARDVVSLSGGHDELHINDETSHGVTVDMGDGSAQSRTRIVDGFDVTSDLLKIDSPENINARILDGSLQFIKGDSRLTFDELATFDDANGLQVQVDGATYELRNDYDSGLSDVDYFWTDTDGNYYITDSTFRIFDDGSTRDTLSAKGADALRLTALTSGATTTNSTSRRLTGSRLTAIIFTLQAATATLLKSRAARARRLTLNLTARPTRHSSASI